MSYPNLHFVEPIYDNAKRVELFLACEPVQIIILDIMRSLVVALVCKKNRGFFLGKYGRSGYKHKKYIVT